MKKITIFIQDHTLLFKYRTNKPVEPNLLNTNVISNNELVFSDEYLLNNVKIVGLFICDLAKEREIKDIVVSNNELGELTMDIIKKLPSIECLTILDDVNLSYSLCEKICKSKNIKKINCYGIPQFMTETLDKHGVEVDSRYEVLFTSNFMAENNLTTFSKIYYKTNINIGDVLVKEDFSDIQTFFIINKYLKIIHFDKCSLENIKAIISLIKEYKIKNITLQIHDDLDDEKIAIELRNLNKELSKSKVRLSLVYSKDYIEKNYFQQIIFSTLKVCSIIMFLIVAIVLGYIFYNNYSSELKINKIKDELNQVMIDEGDTQGTIFQDKKVINSYDKLVEINSDMVGWITVKGTKIDYPIVKSTDNQYYLKRNFYGEEDYNGWVFMDYRNSIEHIHANTIIYAHNRFSSGVMFGTLPDIKKDKWLNNKENHYITFNTLYETGTWKIFSYYSIDVTEDYLSIKFDSDDEHQDFIDMIMSRSAYDFKTEVTTEDKIITLSTCLENDKRFVVHAVKVLENEVQLQS